MNRMTPKRVLMVVLLACAGLLNAEPPTLTGVPPEPEMPDVGGLPGVEREAAIAKWRADDKAWHDGLNAEQKAEIERRETEEDSRRIEEFNRKTRLPLPADGYTWHQAAK